MNLSKRRFTISITLMIICMIVNGITAPTRASADNADIDTGKIDNFLNAAMNKLDIPGASLGIVKGDQLIYQKGYGTAGPDRKPVTPQTSFVIGSLSKSFTALAIMQLVDQGKIDLAFETRSMCYMHDSDALRILLAVIGYDR